MYILLNRATVLFTVPAGELTILDCFAFSYSFVKLFFGSSFEAVKLFRTFLPPFA